MSLVRLYRKCPRKTLHSLLGLTGAYIIAVVLFMISVVILTEKSIMSVIKKKMARKLIRVPKKKPTIEEKRIKSY